MNLKDLMMARSFGNWVASNGGIDNGDGSTGGDIDPDEVRKIVEEYLKENPPATRITINGEEPDENGNFVIEFNGEVPNNVVEF